MFDFVPVTFFMIGAVFLTRIASQMCGDRCRHLTIAGSLLIFLGGFLQATWKLLFTTGVGDFRLLREAQFALVAPGFLLLLIVAIIMARSRAMGENRNFVSILAIAVWKIPLLIVMTLAGLGVQGMLSYIAFRHNAKLSALSYLVTFLALLGMGAMASGEQTVARQWIEQSVNSAGQLGFMLGSILLYRKITSSEYSR